jgi:hypothetical protein
MSEPFRYLLVIGASALLGTKFEERNILADESDVGLSGLSAAQFWDAFSTSYVADFCNYD